jgi:hypothetical protein
MDSRGGISELVKENKYLPELDTKNNPVTKPIPGHCTDGDNE